MILIDILSRTVFQLPHSSSEIVAFDKGLPVVNALVLGNLYEYRPKSLLKPTFFGLHSCYIQYGSIFNQFDVICPQNCQIRVE